LVRRKSRSSDTISPFFDKSQKFNLQVIPTVRTCWWG
jgi:hypothetical protein